jgi:hypothetical protein
MFFCPIVDQFDMRWSFHFRQYDAWSEQRTVKASIDSVDGKVSYKTPMRNHNTSSRGIEEHLYTAYRRSILSHTHTHTHIYIYIYIHTYIDASCMFT